MYKICSIVIILGVLLAFYNIGFITTNSPEITNMSVSSCLFEVHGKVQGVFFRKHTEKFAKSIGVKGWCMNTLQGTVKGEIEAPDKQLQEMKLWLQSVGSPSSRIDKAIFSDVKRHKQPQYSKFEIKQI